MLTHHSLGLLKRRTGSVQGEGSMKTRLPFAFLAMLLLGQAVAVVLFLVLRLRWHINPFGFYVNLIISGGGMGFGLISGLGAVAGCKLAGLPRNRLAIAVTVITTAAALLAYHYCYFHALLHKYGLDHVGISFGDYFSLAFGDAQMRMRYSSTPSHIGRMGYGLLLCDVFWALVTSAALIKLVERLPWCGRCGQFHTVDERTTLHFIDELSLARAVTGLPQAPAARTAALMAIPTHDVPGTGIAGAIRIELIHSHCAGCREHALSERLDVHNGKRYLKGKVNEQHWGAAAPARRIEPTVPESPPAGPRGFGRKGLGA
jgi:hypothetical protein